MSDLVIVAIPASHSETWKISSEKVPHLTLLYLGEQELGPETAHIAEFLEHTASTVLSKFSLDVDRRGVLGDDEADVLFFRKKGHPFGMLQDLRSFLLTDSVIKKAYDSAFQYPEWTPHLTLGYPETPARPDTREYPGIHYVPFDRVALWTGDSEGPTYFLGEYEMDGEVSMSDAVDNFFAHYGIKGMKWGVRRSKAELAKASADGSRVEALRTKAKTSGTNALSNKDLQTAIDRMRLEKQFADLNAQTASKSKGRKFAEALLGDIGATETRRVAKGAVSLAVESGIRKAGHEDLATRIKPKKK